MARRSGRRRGKQDTRGAILAAARATFAERGYDGASIRQVATRAGVDPALVHYYFGSKDELFLAVVQLPIDPATLLPKIVAGGVEGIAERLVRTFLSVWEDPTSGPAFRSLLRGAVSHPLTRRLVREFFATQIVRRLLGELGGGSNGIDPAELPLRASLVASQMFGLALARYILEIEPLASASHETIVAAVAPSIQRYLTGDLSLAPVAAPDRTPNSGRTPSPGSPPTAAETRPAGCARRRRQRDPDRGDHPGQRGC